MGYSNENIPVIRISAIILYLAFSDFAKLSLFLLAKSERMGEMPPRIVRVSHENMKEHAGRWIEILKGQLSAFSCTIDIPITTYSYYDGNILAKYRVVIQ